MAQAKNLILAIIGVVLIIGSALLYADASSTQGDCQSLKGQVVQFLDPEKEAGCANVKYYMAASLIGLAAGIALILINFIRK